MLILDNIEVTLGRGTRLERPVLKHLHLHVKPGEFVVVIGDNGAGKSTLFNVISGYLKPDRGRVIINSHDVTAVPQTVRASLVAKVMQDPRMGTMDAMTIMENMALAFRRGASRKALPFSTASRTRLFREHLALLSMGLEHRLDDLVANLSGGQRQALSLMMATLVDAPILLLDEITAALDPESAEKMMRLVNTIVYHQKRTCLMITHNMTHARTFGERTLLLKDGAFAL